MLNYSLPGGSRYRIAMAMTYRMLTTAFGGRSYIAHCLDISDQSVSMWSTKGLPRLYASRYALIELVKNSDLDDGLRSDLLAYVIDPDN